MCRLSSTYGPAKLSIARKSRFESFLLCWQNSLYLTLSRQSLKYCAKEYITTDQEKKT